MILNPGMVISNRYEIVDKLGSGGMSIVYRAIDNKLDRFVTFKVLREEFINDEEFIKRFKIEARAAGSLSHPNIVNVYDVGNDGDIYYIVMEYIDGYTLKELINKNAPFENDEIIGVSIQIAKALQNAHQNNIVHRDIKPENIMITNKGVVKVTDFGIARAASSTTITVDSTMGSVHYFSPEQARGGFVDVKSDIYSLGIVMFEMATKTLPFDGDSTVTVALKHVNDILPDIQAINPKITESISRIIYKCTQKKSISRYDSSSALIVDLKRALSDDSGEFVYIKDETVSKETIKISQEDVQKIKSESLKYEEESKPVESISKRETSSNFEHEYQKAYKSNVEKKVVVAAIITSLLIILVISYFGMKYLDSIKQVVVTKEDLDRIIGKSKLEAENILEKLEIKINNDTNYVFSEEYEKDYVVDYETGVEGEEDVQLIAGESSVRLILSNGPPLVVVPDFTDVNYNNVDSLLAESSLGKNSNIMHKHSDKPKNIIIDQSPKPNDKVEKGTPITFTISDGPKAEYVSVEYYKNQNIDIAKASLENLGLFVDVKEVYSDLFESGKVIAQSLDAGSNVKPGTEITLTVSKGIEPTTEPSTKPSVAPTTQNTNNISTADLIIDYGDFPEGQETLSIRVLEYKDNQGLSIFEKSFRKDEMPYVLEVSGSGETEYSLQVYSNGSYVDFERKTINFD